MGDCGWSTELSTGSPQKWQKKRLGRYLAINLLVGWLFLIPGFGYLTALIFAVKKLVTCGKSKYLGKPADEFSAPFGVGDTKHYNLKFWFRLLYSLLIIAVWGGITGILYVFVLSGLDEYTCLTILMLLLVSGFIYCTVQIHGVIAFKCEIREYACPQCKFANTVRQTGSSDNKVVDEWRNVGTGGGETVKTGSIYLDGVEVGSTYGKTPTYKKYQQYRTTSWTDYYKCARCGYEFRRYKTFTKSVSGVYKG